MNLLGIVAFTLASLIIVATIIEWAFIATGVVVSAIKYQITSSKDRAKINELIKDLYIQIEEYEMANL